MANLGAAALYPHHMHAHNAGLQNAGARQPPQPPPHEQQQLPPAAGEPFAHVPHAFADNDSVAIAIPLRPGEIDPRERRREARSGQLLKRLREGANDDQDWQERLPQEWIPGDSMVCTAFARNARFLGLSPQESFQLLDPEGNVARFIGTLGVVTVQGRQINLDSFGEVRGSVNRLAQTMRDRNRDVDRAYDAYAKVAGFQRDLDSIAGRLKAIEEEQRIANTSSGDGAASLQKRRRSVIAELEMAKAKLGEALQAASNSQSEVARQEVLTTRFCVEFLRKANARDFREFIFDHRYVPVMSALCAVAVAGWAWTGFDLTGVAPDIARIERDNAGRHDDLAMAQAALARTEEELRVGLEAIVQSNTESIASNEAAIAQLSGQRRMVNVAMGLASVVAQLLLWQKRLF